ncbi:hypothetical protein RSK20926_06852 [Roseobacter sp. SK209-2-6]|uniref:endonuclease/exonuclease/phosphatase family protein n=1 Tax=Roseobacter sp. SK209-2-6 TaxID=388739 RepID=UPI0000F3D7FA|nr:endonuclease/exonuclease/phosphatase family protein [Roseobacter sp. SK209-2-6]EBA17435.1 hypothetical protein RSK20926_06852 [Roseobacter sp. SK209-2-6]
MRRVARISFAPLLFLLGLIQSPSPAGAGEGVRIATYNTEFSRRGPGLLLRDIERGTDPQVKAVLQVIQEIQPDILLLQGVDWDFELRALKALERKLSLAGHPYPHLFMAQPNRGMRTGLDLDGDGLLNGPGDAQGYARFTGKGGIALLSRLPIANAGVTDLSTLLWKDLPGASLPKGKDGTEYFSKEALDILRLATTAHWVIPINLTNGQVLQLLCFQAGTPLFDGVEDRNGLRNRDEIRLWQVFLDGALPGLPSPPDSQFVLLGGANLDPRRGQGYRSAMRDLLEDSRLQDPAPQGEGGGSETVEWAKAGRMRVSYLLPSRDLTVLDAGVLWPLDPEHPANRASRHRLIWADIQID